MTAATVQGDTSLADLLALTTATARAAADHLATIVDVGYRRQLARQLVAQRRQELALAVDVTRERFGRAPSLARLEHDDTVLAELNLLTVA